MNRDVPLVYMAVVPEGAPETMRIDVVGTILSFEYEDKEDGADKLKFDVRNDDLTEHDNPLWKKGNILFVQWGSPGAMSQPRKAIIEKVMGFRTLTIEAHALSMVMNTVSRRRQWENYTRSEVAAEIAEEWGYGSEMQIIEATTQRFETITQAAQPDARFLATLARKQGFVFFVDFDGFHFHSRQITQRTHRTYTYFTDPARGEVKDIIVDNDITAKKAVTISSGINPETGEEIAAGADTQVPDGDLPVENMPLWGEGAPEHPVSPVPEIVGTAIRDRGMELLGRAGALANQAYNYEGAFREALLQQAEHMRDTGRTMLNLPENVRLEHVNGSVVMQAPPDWVERDWTAAEQEALGEAQEIAVGSVRTTSGTFHRLGSEETVQTDATTEEDATTQAKAQQTRMQLTAVKLKMEIRGDPTLLAKTMIELGGVSRRLSGPYYVRSVRHRVLPAPYICVLDMRSDGTRGYGDPQFPEASQRDRARDTTGAGAGAGEENVGVFGGSYEQYMRIWRRRHQSPEGQEYETFDTAGSDRNSGVVDGAA